MKLPIPDLVGVSAPMQNAGKVRNIGFELALTHRNQVNRFRYSTSFNFSYEIVAISLGFTLLTEDSTPSIITIASAFPKVPIPLTLRLPISAPG